jgi:hypothetical protein
MAYNPQSPLSLIDQAFAAWLISFVPTVPAIGIAPDLTQSPPVIGDIFGAVSIQQKPLPCTIIYCEGGPEVSPYTGNYRVKVTIMVKSALAKDITEYLASLNLATARAPLPLTVAYHAACSLQHGQRVVREPKELLSKFGFVVKDVPEGHLCCGSAGTYNILQPELARQLRDRKVANIERLVPDVIAAGNIGCITQIGGGTAIPAVRRVRRSSKWGLRRRSWQLLRRYWWRGGWAWPPTRC